MTPISLTLFAGFWVGLVYLLNSAIARHFKKIDLRMATLYVASVAMLGVFGEIFIGHIYDFIFHKPLWLYHVLPIHGGYTSYFAPVIWGILGFHLYLLHGTLNKKKTRTNQHLALLFAGETLILELAGNWSFLAWFHDYCFYYLPTDLWHLTSVQTLPFYLLAGFVLARTIQSLRTDPKFFTFMAMGLGGVLVFMTS